MTAFPARVGGIFGWEYYPFPPNFPTQLVFSAHEGNPADVPDKNIGNIIKERLGIEA
jgi:hypothetical protein